MSETILATGGAENLAKLYEQATTGGVVPNQRVLVQFNKISGAAVSIISYVDPQTLNNDDYTYKEDVGSPMGHRVVGTVNDYKLIPVSELPQEVTEQQLDAQAADRITKRYKIVDQLNVLRKVALAFGRVLEKLEPELVNEQVYQDLLEMDAYIRDTLGVNKAKKAHYAEAEGFSYVSVEQQEKEYNATVEGGIRDVLGPRPVGETKRIF